MRTPVHIGEILPGRWPGRGSGGFLGLLDGFVHVGREPWCIRAPRRALVVAIIRWATVHVGNIVGPEWTGIGLHTLQARPVCIELGCC